MFLNTMLYKHSWNQFSLLFGKQNFLLSFIFDLTALTARVFDLSPTADLFL